MTTETKTKQIIAPWCIWTLDSGMAPRLLDWSTGGGIATIDDVIDHCRQRLLGLPMQSQIYCLILYGEKHNGTATEILGQESIQFFEILPHGMWRFIESDIDVSALAWTC